MTGHRSRKSEAASEIHLPRLFGCVCAFSHRRLGCEMDNGLRLPSLDQIIDRGLVCDIRYLALKALCMQFAGLRAEHHAAVAWIAFH